MCQSGAKILEKYETQRLAKQMAALWRERKLPRFAKAIEDVVVARNKFHHGQGPKVETGVTPIS